MLKLKCCLGSLTFLILPWQTRIVIWKMSCLQTHLTPSPEHTMSYFLPGARPKTPESLDGYHFHLLPLHQTNQGGEPFMKIYMKFLKYLTKAINLALQSYKTHS